MNSTTKSGQAPQSIAELVAMMTPEIYQHMKTAVEIGRWENGDVLSDEQKAHCLQAVIAYDNANHHPASRVGYLDRSVKKKTACEKSRNVDGDESDA